MVKVVTDENFCPHGYADKDRCVRCENDRLRASLSSACTALHSMREMLEGISDGKSYPALDTIRRQHDLCSAALAEIETLGVEPKFKPGPEE